MPSRAKLSPGSWAEAIHHAAAAGEVPSEAVPVDDD